MSAILYLVNLTDLQIERTVVFGGFTVLPIWFGASFSGVFDLLNTAPDFYEVINAKRNRLVVL